MLSFVVRSGGGSVRDSLSVLDQLIAGSGPEGLTYESAAALLGFTDGELLDAAVDAFAAGDAAGAFRAIEKVIESGLDPRRFVEDLLERLRDLIVVAAVPDGASAVLRALPEDQLDRMRHQAAAFGPGALSRAADLVNAGLTEMTGATAPRLQLELIAARILLPAAAGEAGYAARLDRLERRLDVGGVPSAATPAPATPAPAADVASPLPAALVPAPAAPASAATGHGTAGRTSMGATGVSAPAPSATSAEPLADSADAGEPLPATGRPPGGIDTAAIRRSWPDVLAKIFALKRATWTFLSEHAQVVDYDGDRLLLGISTVGLANTFRRGQHAEYVRQALIDVLGLDVRVEGVPTDEAQASAAAAAAPPPAPRPDPRPLRAAGDDSSADHASWGSPSAGRAQPPAWAGRGADPADPAHRPGAGRTDPTAAAAEHAGSVGASPDAASAGAPPAVARPGTAGPGSPATAMPGPARRPAPPAEAREPGDDPPSAGGRGPRVVDDRAVSLDDEDVAELGEVGLPVIQRILGATIIDDEAP